MAEIVYRITNGVAPFVVSLNPSVVPDNNNPTTGEYSFTGVPDGNYTLRITDSTGCFIDLNVDVNCTTTTTIAPSTTTSTTHADLPALKTCLDDALIFEETITDFTPPLSGSGREYYGGGTSQGSNIVETDDYIIIIFNDSYENDYKHHIVYRYNKTTEAISWKRITTQNSYCCDQHKIPTALITSSGSLLVAIEELPGDSNHNGAIDIFRWADPSDLDTYNYTVVGNSSTERLAYPFLWQVGSNIIIEARRYSGIYSTGAKYRVYYVSSDDGVSFGSMNEYVTYTTNGWWMYARQVGNNSTTNPILLINPLTPQEYKYVTFLRTDWTGNFYALDGTNLGTNVSETELINNYSWGDNTIGAGTFYQINYAKIFGDYIYAIGLIDYNKPALSWDVDDMQIVKVNINTGAVTTGNVFTYVFDPSFFQSLTLFNICDDIYLKCSYDGDMYYYKIAQDLNSIDLIYVEEGDYNYYNLTNLHSELTADYDEITKVLRVYRMSDPDTVWDLTTTTSTTGLPVSTTTTTTSESTTTTTTTTAIPDTLKCDLVSCYMLDEASGTTAYDDHGSNDLTNTNATINQSTTITNIPKSYLFNGLSSRLDGSISLSYPFTLNVWFYWDGSTIQNSVLSISNGSDAYHHTIGLFNTNNENDVAMRAQSFGGTNTFAEDQDSSYQVQEWHMITGVYESDTSRKLYVDGVFIEENTDDCGTVGLTKVAVGVTADSTPYGFAGGNIAEPSVWDKALSVDEILALYNSDNGLHSTNFGTCVTTTTTSLPTTTTTTEEPTTTTTTIIEPETDYGLLYNWYAATDVRNIANEGWHLPLGYQDTLPAPAEYVDFAILVEYLDPAGDPNINVAGKKIKEIGTTYWSGGNDSTNESGFNGRGSGMRTSTFNELNTLSYFWMTSLSYGMGGDYADAARLAGASDSLQVSYEYNGYQSALYEGHAIRLIKDTTTLSHGETGSYIGNNGIIYPTICIGTQEWLACNLEETKFRDGSDIPYIGNDTADDATWAAATTAAYCIYPIT